jgi:hypothetical protein
VVQYPDSHRQAEQRAAECDPKVKEDTPNGALALQGIQQAICHVAGGQGAHELEHHVIAERAPRRDGEDGWDDEEQTHNSQKASNPTRRAENAPGEQT